MNHTKSDDIGQAVDFRAQNHAMARERSVSDDRYIIASHLMGLARAGAGSPPAASRPANTSEILGMRLATAAARTHEQPAQTITPAPIEQRRESGPEVIRVDVELARLANALHTGTACRVWFVARALDTAGRGMVARDALEAGLHAHKVSGIANMRRLLSAGSGIYWDVVADRVYLRGKRRVAETLTRRAVELERDELVYTNRPGDRRDVWLWASGSIGQWERAILHAWLYSRGRENWLKAEHQRKRRQGEKYKPSSEKPFITISGRKLAQLFGRSERSIRYWLEALRKRRQIGIQCNYAQAPTDTKFKTPDNAKEYIANTPDGEVIRHRWRISSTYYPRHFGIREHGHRGQASTVRAASTAAIQPDDHANRAARYRRYFYDAEHIDKVSSKHGAGYMAHEVRYLRIGTNRHGHGIWEPLTRSAFQQTRPHERAHYSRERELIGDVLY